MLPAMLLAAGFGTRLRPLTEACPKPLVPVGDRPLLGHIVDRLRKSGVEQIVVNAHHRAGDLAAFVRGEGRGILVSEEPELLGTAGGVARARDLLGQGDILVWNADILAPIDVQSLVHVHAASGADATLVVGLLARGAKGAGNVGVDGAGRIVRLRDTRIADETQGAEFVPVHVLGGGLRRELPERGCLVGDLYIRALRRGALLRAFPSDSTWYDVGSIASYLAANLGWLEDRSLDHWLGDGVRLAPGVRTLRTVVGAGASVVGAGVLERCVVWPGATAVAPLTDSIVAGDLVVRVGTIS